MKCTILEGYAKRPNLYTRDMLLAAYLQEQAVKYGYTVYEVDGSGSPAELANRIAQHFAAFLFK